MVHTAPDRRRERGKGPAWVLAALGILLVAAAAVVNVGLPALDRAGSGVAPRAARATADPAGPSQPAPAGRAAPVVRRAAAAGRPVRLEIPALHVAAPVTPVALEDQVLVPPADPQLLGWWQGGAVPGAARGTAVIAGHTVHTGGGALDHLGDVHRGDVLRLTTGGGVLDYRVRTVTVYSKASLGSQARELFAQEVRGRLAVVTCADWNGHSYDSNVVVLASPIPER